MGLHHHKERNFVFQLLADFTRLLPGAMPVNPADGFTLVCQMPVCSANFIALPVPLIMKENGIQNDSLAPAINHLRQNTQINLLRGVVLSI